MPVLEKAQVEVVNELVQKLKKDPSLIDDPELKHLRELLFSWGAKIPVVRAAPEVDAETTSPSKEAPKVQEVVEEEEEEDVLEEPEEEDPERMVEDKPPFPEKGPSSSEELTDDQMDKQSALKQEAAEAVEDGELAKAIDKLSEAFRIGGVSALMYTKRAELLLKVKRPCACIEDCNAAIEINPDSGKAYRIRGKANRFLGRWEAAHNDLAIGQKLDFDDDVVVMAKLVDNKYKKISERKTQQRLKNEQKKLAERKRRQEEAKRIYEEEKAREKSGKGGGYGGGMPGGSPGFPGSMGGMGEGMGGFGGMPPGMEAVMAALMSDPELTAAMSNPKVMAAFQDIMTNPGNIGKYQSDPEIMGLMSKMSQKMGGLGGMGGGMPNMGGMGSSMGGQTPANPGPTVEEVDEID